MEWTTFDSRAGRLASACRDESSIRLYGDDGRAVHLRIRSLVIHRYQRRPIECVEGESAVADVAVRHVFNQFS